MGFANSMLNGFEFSLRALNDRAFKPMTRTDQPPDRNNQEHPQHYHRCVVEALERYGGGRWQHKHHRDQDNPYHSDPANRPAPGSQMPWSSLEVCRKLAQENGNHIRDIETDDGNRNHRQIG